MGSLVCALALQTGWIAACGSADPEGPAAAPVFEIRARGLAFEAPERASPGWTTLRLVNESGMVHFALLQRLPEGIGREEHQSEVAPVFQAGMDLLAAGRTDAGLKEFEKLPAWYGDFVFVGGPGLVAAGQTSEVTTLLEPGTYLLECYVKTDGVFHSFSRSPGTHGMVHQFTVADEEGHGTEPSADLRVHVDAEHGIRVEGEAQAGDRTIAVVFGRQTVHENAVGHDLHLARLDDSSDLEALARWMDWTRPGGLDTPAPVSFVGGVNEMPAGSTAYLHVRLEPGRYAWVSEVPDPDRKGVLEPFQVD